MKRPFRLIGIVVGLTCLWIVPSHAITLHVSDDQTVRIDEPISNPNHHLQQKWKSRLRNFYSKVTQHTTISIGIHRQRYEEQGFVKFDLSPLPLDGQIQSATLRLWLNTVQKSGPLHFHEILANWEEDNIDAQHLPPLAPAFDNLVIGKNDNNQFITIDITALVQEWLTNPAMNFGLALVADPTDPLLIKFDSKENTSTSHPMEIEVTLEPGSGREGPQGIQGPQGSPGEQGPTGERGAIGNSGPPGPVGPPGSDGDTGAPGKNGTTWLTGAEVPTFDQGIIGDFYLESNTGQYFTKTDSSTWILLGNLQGPKGNDGQTGAQGNSGLQGIQGIPGPSGTQGPPGPTGSPGPQGAPGFSPILVMVGQNCPTGEFLTGFDALGNILCGTPPTSSELPTPTALNDVNPGDVIITEIMINPSAVSDANGEWFELFNAFSETIDLRGWRIEDEDGNTHTIPDTDPILIPAGEFLVLGRNGESSSNGGITIAHEYNTVNLNNSSGDILVLFDINGEEIDRVNYGANGFTVPAGASINLDPDSFSLNANDNGSNWCSSTTSIGPGLDSGTPGAANETC